MSFDSALPLDSSRSGSIPDQGVNPQAAARRLGGQPQTVANTSSTYRRVFDDSSYVEQKQDYASGSSSNSRSITDANSRVRGILRRASDSDVRRVPDRPNNVGRGANQSNQPRSLNEADSKEIDALKKTLRRQINDERSKIRTEMHQQEQAKKSFKNKVLPWLVAALVTLVVIGTFIVGGPAAGLAALFFGSMVVGAYMITRVDDLHRKDKQKERLVELSDAGTIINEPKKLKAANEILKKFNITRSGENRLVQVDLTKNDPRNDKENIEFRKKIARDAKFWKFFEKEPLDEKSIRNHLVETYWDINMQFDNDREIQRMQKEAKANLDLTPHARRPRRPGARRQAPRVPQNNAASAASGTPPSGAAASSGAAAASNTPAASNNAAPPSGTPPSRDPTG